MRTLLLAAIAASALAAPAFAADAMATFYANTAVVKDSAGVVLKYQFDANGKYTIVTPDGAKATGSYTTANGKICLKADDPKVAPGCAPLVEGKKVGDTWDITNDQGQKLSVTLAAGR